ncbi:hypothetical protein Daus18300_007127 [Diaporthe australafricana]|uniref:Uncharacterized protein n=1 Tax=Diaporthe australafricana TaxID=127596 RepID=A0ABR3WPW7_9PEZI
MEPGPGGNNTASDTVGDQGRGKGKCKDVVRNETNQDQEPQRTPSDAESIMSRVGRSVTSLSQSVLHGKPTASDLVDVSSSEKAGPSSSIRPPALGEASYNAPRSGTSGTSVFRSAQANAHVAAEEAAFSDFLDGTPAFVATEQPTSLEQAWQGAGGDGALAAPGTIGAPRLAGASSVAEQQARDGVEVVRLLSQTTEDEAPEFEASHMISQEDLTNLRRALFEDEASGQISATDWNNVLNFVPDFLREESDGPGREASGDRHMNLGVTEPAEAGQVWLEQWNRVLTGYTDEVWGDLGALVEEARTEVAQLKDTKDEQATGAPAPAPAVRQLRTILSHVRARL